MGFQSYNIGNGGGGPNMFGWDDDLGLDIPALTFDSDLSSGGITELQALLGITTDSGALKIDLNEIVLQGAPSGSKAVFWLDGMELAQVPFWAYAAAQFPATNGSGGSSNHGHVGFEFYYYDSPEDPAPSAIPKMPSATPAYIGFGYGGAATRQIFYRGWNTLSAANANSLYGAATASINVIDSNYFGIYKIGATYPPGTTTLQIPNNRVQSGTDAEVSATHRIRVALSIYIDGTVDLPVILIKKLDIRYTRP